MSEQNPIEEFEQFLGALPESDRIWFCQKLKAVYEWKIKELDETWQNIDYGRPEFKWKPLVIGQAVEKKTLLEMIDYLNKFIYPEAVKGETSDEEVPEVVTG